MYIRDEFENAIKIAKKYRIIHGCTDEIYLRVFNLMQTSEISIWTQQETFHISNQPCIISTIFGRFPNIFRTFPNMWPKPSHFFFPSQIINCTCFLMYSGDNKFKTLHSTMRNVKIRGLKYILIHFYITFFNYAISSTFWHAHELRSFYTFASDGNNVYVDPSKISRT